MCAYLQPASTAPKPLDPHTGVNLVLFVPKGNMPQKPYQKYTMLTNKNVVVSI